MTVQSGKCVILAARWLGEEAAFLSPGEGDLLLCADAGYVRARAFGWTPALTIGDWDSLPLGTEVQGPRRTVPAHKDDTDTVLCVQEGRARGYRHFRVGGGLGGRLDHTLANLQLAADCALRGESLWLCDTLNRVTVLAPGEYILPRMPDRKLSLLAFSEHVRGVTLRGTEWELTDAELHSRVPLGVSNEWRADAARLSFREGLLLFLASGEEETER